VCQFSAQMVKDILGDFALSLDTLSDTRWLLLLRFAKALEVLSTLRSVGMRTGLVLWPQRWVSD